MRTRLKKEGKEGRRREKEEGEKNEEGEKKEEGEKEVECILN
jgi:hypothetical protein